MSDKEMNDMGMEEQALLGQMVTEALLRDSQAAPDASSEWQKLAARMNANSKKPLRPLWIAISAAAAIALVASTKTSLPSIRQRQSLPTSLFSMRRRMSEW